MTAKAARKMIRNSRCFYIPSLAAFLCCIADRALVAGAGMPWEGPIMQIVSSLTGPVAKGIGIVAIAGSGFGLAMLATTSRRGIASSIRRRGHAHLSERFRPLPPGPI